MNTDILECIHAYRRELEMVEETIRFVNEKYNDLLDVQFDTLDDVLHFRKVLETELSSATFFVFEGRCRCHPYERGHWTYMDESPLTIGTLLEFIRHLKSQGFLCEHEKVHSVQTCHIVCLIQVNVTSCTVQEASPAS